MKFPSPWASPGLQALCLALAAQASAQVTVTPQAVLLYPGQRCLFTAWNAGDPGWGAAGGWEWTLRDEAGGGLAGAGSGTLDAQGNYTATVTETPLLVRVRATHGGRAGPSSEATLLVLPRELYPVRHVLAPHFQEAFSTARPFLDIETGARFDPGAAVTPWPLPGPRPPGLRLQYAPVGLPTLLTWDPPAGAEGQLLSYRDGDLFIRRDVTGRNSQEVTFQGRVDRVRIEALRRAPGQADAWQSWEEQQLMRQRGLVPFAGKAEQSGHLNGTGLSARFREPFDGVGVFREETARLAFNYVVSDAGSHCLRLVTGRGRVTTLAGRPDQAGHRDGPAQEALFKGPTFLAARGTADSKSGATWECAVADSGNHVIRLLCSDGTVTTLAGTPGKAGHHDGPGGQAEFSNPLGIVLGATGIYVADQGNAVIRKIDADGYVTTIAGVPGELGSRDGHGTAARFTDVKGLCLMPQNRLRETLYLTDGHAIRKISLPEVKVETLLGAVADRGWLEVTREPFEDRPAALLQPCLNDPWGIRWEGRTLFIADRGNHAIRAYNFPYRTLRTLAGDPGQTEFRPGLIRDGMAPPPDAGYAALAAPRSLISCKSALAFLVPTGSCLTRLDLDGILDPMLEPPRLECPGAMEAGPLMVTFSVATHLPYDYTLDFLEADGKLGKRVRGQGVAHFEQTVPGELLESGTGKVQLRCVNMTGISTGSETTVQVR